MSNNNSQKQQKKNLPIHLLAGGIAGCCEAVTCHPLDTIKVRLQLRGERLSNMKPSIVNGLPHSTNGITKVSLLLLY